MKGFITLPYEVLSNIISNIDFDDVVSLGKTCKAFEFLRDEESISKQVLQSKIPFSNEAQSAKAARCGYASAMRSAAKRSESLVTATPFVIAIVAIGDAYLYCHGVLCYTLDDRIRIIDLHNSGKDETVINIPALLTRALPSLEDNSRGHFQVLYYSDDIVSCLYKTSGADPDAWLIAFNQKTRRLLVAEGLFSTDKIFVRHNHQYLYFGTHSEIGADGYKKWVVHGFNFTAQSWYPEKVFLPNLVGSEIGSTICFEFYNDHFYALSNQTSFEVEEIDWTSYYHCFRFPLDSPGALLLEHTQDEDMWRRQHHEGPIDDRWTSLRLDIDETSGELKIVESRKEWYLGSSKSQITYYKTDIVFKVTQEDMDDLLYGSAASVSNATAPTTSATASTIMATPSAPVARKLHNHDFSLFPDDQLLRLVRPDDNPHHMFAQPRLPQNTHPGNDGSHNPKFTLAKSRIRHYHTAASTYLDLVDDPDPTDWQGSQRLRLRAGSRRLGPPLLDAEGYLRGPSENLTKALEEMYIEREIAFWPPSQDPKSPNPELEEVYRLLNPPSHLGNVHGTADERSLVYSTGMGVDEPKALVFVGFDPAVRLGEYKHWGAKHWERNPGGKGVGEGPHIDGRATGSTNEGDGGGGGMYVDVAEQDRTVVMDRKGKGRMQAQNDVEVQLCDVEDNREAGMVVGVHRAHGQSWAWNEKAMYWDIGAGFYFDYTKREDRAE